MRRLDRYILREILFPTLIGLAALTFVTLSREMGRLLAIIVKQVATPGEILALFAAILPNILTFTLPMSVLVGILTGFGRMSSDSEIIALRAAGIPMRRILAPVMVLGISAWLLTAAMTSWLAPAMSLRIDTMKRNILVRQVSLELQPGVFSEDIKGVTLYVRSILANRTEWHDILLNDMRNKDEDAIIIAASGFPRYDEATQSIQITLRNGISHLLSYTTNHKYDWEQWDQRTVTVSLPPVPAASEFPPASTISTATLLRRLRRHTATYEERVEFHRRLALPFACIAFVLVGLPLGVSTTRGSKSMGLIMSLVLMFLYYLAFFAGTRIASDSNLSPLLGTWIPNMAFLLLGVVLMLRADREHENYLVMWSRSAGDWIGAKASIVKKAQQRLAQWAYSLAHRSRLFRVLDRYVLRGFIFYFTLVLVVFSALFIIVTLFELLPDIVKNHIGLSTIVYYFFFLMPQILYWVVPLTVLLAILINLGTLTKANEILAVKAAGMSLYRLTIPLLVMGFLVSCGIYLMQDFMMPYANRKQDAYRDMIKGKAPQTYQNPDRKWMAGSDGRIYHYNFFDPSRDFFGNLSIFKFDPNSFNLRELTYASSAIWKQDRWVLDHVVAVQVTPDGKKETGGEPLASLTLTDMDRPEYFKDEVRAASQMTTVELKHYLDDLKKKQFNVTSLTLDLYRKLSFPLVSFIMVLIGIPFSFKTGKKGAFYGIGICIGLGILYWSTFQLFDKLGEMDRLSPLVAAWFPNLIFGLGGTWMMLRVKT